MREVENERGYSRKQQQQNTTGCVSVIENTDLGNSLGDCSSFLVVRQAGRHTTETLAGLLLGVIAPSGGKAKQKQGKCSGGGLSAVFQQHTQCECLLLLSLRDVHAPAPLPPPGTLWCAELAALTKEPAPRSCPALA